MLKSEEVHKMLTHLIFPQHLIKFVDNKTDLQSGVLINLIFGSCMLSRYITSAPSAVPCPLHVTNCFIIVVRGP